VFKSKANLKLYIEGLRKWEPYKKEEEEKIKRII
jgi:hypothetical protein